MTTPHATRSSRLRLRLNVRENDEHKLFERLQSSSHGDLTITIKRTTNTPRFIRVSKGGDLSSAGAAAQRKGGSRSDASMNFLHDYGKLFGITDATTELAEVSMETDRIGMTHLSYQQMYKGVPVLGAVLKSHFDEDDHLTAVNGLFVPDIDLDLDVEPSFKKADAYDVAMKAVVKDLEEKNQNQIKDQALFDSKLGNLFQNQPPLRQSKSTNLFQNQNQNNIPKPFVKSCDLYVMRSGLLNGQPGGQDYLVYELEITNERTIRGVVYINAHTGDIILKYSRIDHALYRRLYKYYISASTRKWQENFSLSGSLDSAAEQNIVNYTADSYYFFLNSFGRDSYDGYGHSMDAVIESMEFCYFSAFWDGIATDFCSGYALDDVVGHEWGHAYTEYISDLVYYEQPGALNEAFSDIWGETIDLLNGEDDGPTDQIKRSVGDCFDGSSSSSSSVRWLMGEDYQPDGAFRDLWNPKCFENPSSMSDPLFYCGVDDSGVHFNSAVPTHGYALLVDGGSFNGHDITGIGLVKAAHIFWHAHVTYLTSSSDFADLADALQESCSNLINVTLNELSTSSSSSSQKYQDQITEFDCSQVDAMIDAIGLNLDYPCNGQILKPNPPSLGSGKHVTLFEEDFENGFGHWILKNFGLFEGWNDQNWELSSSLPDGHAGSAAFAANLDTEIGDCGWGEGDISGYMMLESPPISLSELKHVDTDDGDGDGGGGVVMVSFDHYVATEPNFDGGILALRINGNETFHVIGRGLFTFNAYNEIDLYGSNPFQGYPAFTGTNYDIIEQQYTGEGNWGQSHVDLSSFGLTSEDVIQFSFIFTRDGCDSLGAGWYVDNVKVVLFGTNVTDVDSDHDE